MWKDKLLSLSESSVFVAKIPIRSSLLIHNWSITPRYSFITAICMISFAQSTYQRAINCGKLIEF